MGIEEYLLPKHVNLALKSTDRASALDEVMAPLRGDVRIQNWEKLRASVLGRDAPAVSEHGRGVCLAHGRSDAVNHLIMAAGKFVEPIAFPEIPEKVYLVFVVGIPTTMRSEYLRVIGSIARICRDPVQLEHLLRSRTAEEFIQRLAAGEA